MVRCTEETATALAAVSCWVGPPCPATTRVVYTHDLATKVACMLSATTPASHPYLLHPALGTVFLSPDLPVICCCLRTDCIPGAYANCSSGICQCSRCPAGYWCSGGLNANDTAAASSAVTASGAPISLAAAIPCGDGLTTRTGITAMYRSQCGKHRHILLRWRLQCHK